MIVAFCFFVIPAGRTWRKGDFIGVIVEVGFIGDRGNWVGVRIGDPGALEGD